MRAFTIHHLSLVRSASANSPGRKWLRTDASEAPAVFATINLIFDCSVRSHLILTSLRKVQPQTLRKESKDSIAEVSNHENRFRRDLYLRLRRLILTLLSRYGWKRSRILSCHIQATLVTGEGILERRSHGRPKDRGSQQRRHSESFETSFYSRCPSLTGSPYKTATRDLVIPSKSIWIHHVVWLAWAGRSGKRAMSGWQEDFQSAHNGLK